METITHNNLPEAVATLLWKIDRLYEEVQQLKGSRVADDKMTIQEVSELTHKAVSTLYRYTSNKTIPHQKIGNDLSFSRKEIERWMSEHSVKLASEIESEAEERMIALNKKKAPR